MRSNWHVALLATALAASITIGTAAAQNAARSQSTSGDSRTQLAWFEYISSELRQIHLEVLAQRRELQQAKLESVQRDLESIQAQQRQLQDEQRAQAQQAAEVEAQLGQSTLTQAERDELQSQKAELAASPTRFGSAENALALREARALEGLAIQEQRVQEIDRQLRELTAATR